MAELGVLTDRTEEELKPLLGGDGLAALMTPELCGDAPACDAVRATLRDDTLATVQVVDASTWSLEKADVDASARGLTPAEKAGATKLPRVVVVHVKTATGQQALALRTALAASAAIARKVHGLVWDQLLARIESGRTFASHAVTAPLEASAFRRDRVEVLYEPKAEGVVRVLTAGLSRWGEPDVEAVAVPTAAAPRVAEVVLAAAEALANGATTQPLILSRDDLARARGQAYSVDGGLPPVAPVEVEVVTAQPENGDPNDFIARVVPSVGEGPIGYVDLAERFFGPLLAASPDNDVLDLPAREGAGQARGGGRRVGGAEDDRREAPRAPALPDPGRRGRRVDVDRGDEGGRAQRDGPGDGRAARRDRREARRRGDAAARAGGGSRAARGQTVSKATPAVLLGVAVAAAMGAWWLFGGEKRAPAPATSPNEDLELVVALLDGAAAEPPRDVLVAGAEELYLARAGDRTVVAVGKKGGTPRVLARLDAPAHGMALAAAALWVTTGRAVEKIPMTGGEPQLVADRLARPRAVACDGRWVFVVDVDPTRQGMTRGSAVVRIPAAGGERTVLGRSEGEISGLALDDANVYWADGLDGTIVAVPKTGGAPRTLASERGLPRSVVVSGGALTWVEKRSESLWTMPSAGGPPRRVAQDFAGFANLVQDPRGVFWTNEAAVDGAFRVLTVGPTGDVEPLSASVNGVDALASDGAWLYWDRGGEASAVAGL